MTIEPEPEPAQEASAPIVAIPPPSPTVRDGVARLVIEILTRRVLADLGIIVLSDNELPRQLPAERGNVAPIF